MYLQLAENEETELYIPVETNQGTIYVKNPSLSAGGRGLQIAGRILSTAGKFIPIPGANVAAGVIGNIATRAGQAKASGGSAFNTAAGMVPQGAGQKIGGFFQKLKDRRAAKQGSGAEMAPAATGAEMARMPIATEEMPRTFWQKYKTPILIGGGVLIAGTAAALILKKRKR